ncbi:Uncharacterised protein [Yersinia frederiksenii]|nr:Uncharacterised protein [Yersinia frederiksenii]
MGVEPTLRCEDHARVGEAGNQAKRHPGDRLHERHMEKGGHRGNGREAGEGSDMSHGDDDRWQHERADRETREIEGHHRADRAGREPLMAGSHDQERAQQAIAQQQSGDAQQQRRHRRENEAALARRPHGIHRRARSRA